MIARKQLSYDRQTHAMIARKKPPPASANWPARRVPAAGISPALERLNESGRKDLAEARLGSKENPRPGASGLDNDVKASLRQFVDKKPANN
jgi:hypothetical protein